MSRTAKIGLVICIIGIILLAVYASKGQSNTTSVKLHWTATGSMDTLAGTFTINLAGYDIRYSTDSATLVGWNGATKFVSMPSPAKVGKPDSTTVTGLQYGTTYYFAIVCIDSVGRQSNLSNIAKKRTPFNAIVKAVTDLF